MACWIAACGFGWGDGGEVGETELVDSNGADVGVEGVPWDNAEGGGGEGVGLRPPSLARLAKSLAWK